VVSMNCPSWFWLHGCRAVCCRYSTIQHTSSTVPQKHLHSLRTEKRDTYIVQYSIWLINSKSGERHGTFLQLPLRCYDEKGMDSIAFFLYTTTPSPPMDGWVDGDGPYRTTLLLNYYRLASVANKTTMELPPTSAKVRMSLASIAAFY
jgi:hypothetical protein